jgi:hypothetical protein
MTTVITRCDPPVPMDTPHGPGLAHWRIERGIECETAYEVWITSGDHACEIWEFEQSVLRSLNNVTAQRAGLKRTHG